MKQEILQTRLALTCLCLLVLGCVCAAYSSSASDARETLRTFRSFDEHYTVRYPDSWHPLDQGPTLFIINFPDSERIKGGVISNRGAAITGIRQSSDIKTVDEWVSDDSRTMDVVEADEEIPMAKPDPAGCLKLRRMIATLDVGRDYLETIHYCSTRRGIYKIDLVMWSDNPDRVALQATALKIVLSLRVR